MLDAKNSNLHSLALPLELADPNRSSPYQTGYKMTIGAHSKPLKISTHVLIAIKGNGLDMHNDILIDFGIDSARMLVSFTKGL